MKIHPDGVPLRTDASGAIRVGETRVLFYLVVEAFKGGNTPEQIASAYDSLVLADVYGVIAYYLRHQSEVDEFLRDLDADADEIRRTIEAAQPPRAEVRRMERPSNLRTMVMDSTIAATTMEDLT